MKHQFEFLGVKLLDAFLCALPRSWALKLGECLGQVAAWVLPSRRRLILDNLRHAFPDRDEKELRDIAYEVWSNLGRVAAEFVRLSDISRANFRKYFSFEGLEHVNAAKKAGRGIIFITSHLANWEYSGVAVQFLMGDVVAIARPMKNLKVESWVRGKRSVSGLEFVMHRNAVKSSLRALKANKAVGILVDQNLYTGGVFVNFFGRPAATTTLPALLHARTGAPVIVVYARREKSGFKIVFEKPLEFPKTIDKVRDVKIHTQIFTKAIERVVRQQPEQWFWIHNRWKRKPGSSSLQDAGVH